MDTSSQNCKVPPHIEHHFKAWATSGKNIKEYSKKVGLSPLTFYAWRKKYLTSKSQADSIPPAVSKQQRFSTVGTISLPEIRQPLFDIELCSGQKVCVYPGTTVQQLAPFIELLSGGFPC
jgi:hypothetical protein